MTLLAGIITILLFLTILVVLHEFGHFFTARLFKVRVFEFGIGFPPRLFGVWSRKETIKTTKLPAHTFYHPSEGDVVKIYAFRSPEDKLLYAQSVWLDAPGQGQQIEGSPDAEIVIGKVKAVTQDSIEVASIRWTLNLLPIGGFVKMLGEDERTREGSLARKNYFVRIAVIGMGVAINALLPFIILPASELLPVQRSIGPVEVAYVLPGSAAAAGQLMAGDVIVSIDAEPINEPADLTTAVIRGVSSETVWEVTRGGETVLLLIAPDINAPQRVVGDDISLADARLYNPELGPEDILTPGPVGIRTTQPTAELVTQGKPLFTAVWDGWRFAVDTLVLIFKGLANIFTSGENPLDSFAGPIGAGQVATEIIDMDMDIASRLRTLLFLAAVISFSLAIFNALPFPPLDGGHLLFIFVQIINRGRPVPASVPRALNLIGFALVIMFAIYIAFNDISRITGS